MQDSELIKVGTLNSKIKELLGIEINGHEIYRSKGLPAHMIKRKHYKCLKYIDYIPEIIETPDYVGINPNESGVSIELIKRYNDNLLVGIKLDEDGDYYYVSTMHNIQESKISRRLYSGRLISADGVNVDTKKK